MSGDITMTQVVEALREVYDDEGVAIFLGAYNAYFEGFPIEMCRTHEGRYELWVWAQGATGMVAT